MYLRCNQTGSSKPAAVSNFERPATLQFIYWTSPRPMARLLNEMHRPKATQRKICVNIIWPRRRNFAGRICPCQTLQFEYGNFVVRRLKYVLHLVGYRVHSVQWAITPSLLSIKAWTFRWDPFAPHYSKTILSWGWEKWLQPRCLAAVLMIHFLSSKHRKSLTLFRRARPLKRP